MLAVLQLYSRYMVLPNTRSALREPLGYAYKYLCSVSLSSRLTLPLKVVLTPTNISGFLWS